MDFTVYVDENRGEGVSPYAEYHGSSSYEVLAAGALEVRPEQGGRVTFGPAGWSRVEESSARYSVAETIH